MSVNGPLLHAYTDESGNTGLNIFDRQQPYFYTLTLLGRGDLDAEAQPYVEHCCAELGVPELHATDLGIGLLEKIAPKLSEFIYAAKPLFIITVVEKRHMAVMKFVDTVLDSGLNDAVSGFHYWLAPMRLRLALDIAGHMSRRSEREFWECYKRTDTESFRNVVGRVESSIAMRMTDPRGRQLLVDALQWARANPDVLLAKRSKLDAPNLVAFSYIIDALHKMLDGTGLKVGKFVHDRQNEFIKSFEWMYELVTKYKRDDLSGALLPSSLATPTRSTVRLPKLETRPRLCRLSTFCCGSRNVCSQRGKRAGWRVDSCWLQWSS